MDSDRLDRSDVALSLVMVLGLALPFVPVPGDAEAHMEVRFHAPGMDAPRAFSADTSLSLCSIMARALDYDEPGTGNFTRVTCAE